jgi:hypothetical protein
VNTGVQRGVLQLAAGMPGARMAFTRRGEALIAGPAGSAPTGFGLMPMAGFPGASTGIAVWDIRKGEQIDELKLPMAQALALSDDSRQLLVATSQAVLLFRQSGGKWTNSQTVTSALGIAGLWWLPGPTNDFAALAATGELAVWDTRNLRKAYFTAAAVQQPVSFSRDGKRVAFLRAGAPTVEAVSANNKAARPATRGPDGPGMPVFDPLRNVAGCAAVAFCPTSDYLAEGYTDGRIVIRDEQDDREVATFTTASPVYHLAWSPLGDRLASAHLGSVRVWDTSQWVAPAAAEEPSETPQPQPQPVAEESPSVREDVAAKIKEAQTAITDKKWAIANGIVAQLEAADLRPAEAVLLYTRVKRELTDQANKKIQQAGRGYSRTAARQLLNEATKIDPNGPGGKRAAKLLGSQPDGILP